ncbi:MAG: GNAT family N-acetyltransferase [Firmicutes bacterium]|nr:GNAT family N-acetyltransferase [Bacillota bacterium]
MERNNGMSGNGNNRNEAIHVLTPLTRDLAPEVHRIAGEAPPLDVYPLHVYAIILRDFGRTCMAAVAVAETAGFVTGYLAGDRSDRYFLWQIGVGMAFRRRGIGGLLLASTLSLAREAGAREIFATVDPENEPSLLLFSRQGFKPRPGLFGDPVVDGGGLPLAGNHYRTGNNQVIMHRPLP